MTTLMLMRFLVGNGQAVVIVMFMPPLREADVRKITAYDECKANTILESDGMMMFA